MKLVSQMPMPRQRRPKNRHLSVSHADRCAQTTVKCVPNCAFVGDMQKTAIWYSLQHIEIARFPSFWAAICQGGTACHASPRLKVELMLYRSPYENFPTVLIEDVIARFRRKRRQRIKRRRHVP